MPRTTAGCDPLDDRAKPIFPVPKRRALAPKPSNPARPLSSASRPSSGLSTATASLRNPARPLTATRPTPSSTRAPTLPAPQPITAPRRPLASSTKPGPSFPRPPALRKAESTPVVPTRSAVATGGRNPLSASTSRAPVAGAALGAAKGRPAPLVLRQGKGSATSLSGEVGAARGVVAEREREAERELGVFGIVEEQEEEGMGVRSLGMEEGGFERFDEFVFE